MTTTVPRFVVRQDRGWYVLDRHTGAVWTGLTRPGAVQLAAHKNRTA